MEQKVFVVTQACVVGFFAALVANSEGVTHNSGDLVLIGAVATVLTLAVVAARTAHHNYRHHRRRRNRV